MFREDRECCSEWRLQLVACMKTLGLTLVVVAVLLVCFAVLSIWVPHWLPGSRLHDQYFITSKWLMLIVVIGMLFFLVGFAFLFRCGR